MELTSPTIIKELLSKYEAKPSKGLGQNFLIDKNILNKIVSAADLKPTDVILEVGPGLGTLTKELAENGGKIVAVEKDETMIKILEETLSGYKHIEVINGDILEIDPLPNAKNYKVVANIPYYLTSPLIRKFLESENPPTEIILMLQKEVAQRICPSTSLRAGAKPKMNLLAVSVQFYAEPKIISYVSKNCFWPTPKIDSAIIKITPFGTAQGRPPKYDISPDLFFKIVKAGFSQPRKQLLGNLSKGLKINREKIIKWIAKSKINPTQRAETLSIKDWINLTNTLNDIKID